MVYFFETLPLHLRPERLESFTSYLSRLARANGIQHVAQLASACFPDQSLPGVKSFKDYPPASFGTLISAAKCPEQVIRATTFFHMGKKFGRYGDPRAVSSFLNGSVAKSLRFCPTCLKERGYYSLLWRFPALQGCSGHGCRLLDKCGHCEREIPIFVSPFKMSTCPFCKGNLGECLSRPLARGEQQETLLRSIDFAFLLSPQPWETIADSASQRIGEQLALLREARGLTVQKMSRQSGMSEQKIDNVEFGGSLLAMVTFQSYLEYTMYMGASFQDIFGHVLLQSRENEAVRVDEFSPLEGEDAMIERVLHAVQYLNDNGELVTEKAIRRITRLAHIRLMKYPCVKALLKEAIYIARCERERRKEQSKKEMFMGMQEAVHGLEALGQRVTLKALSEVTGLPPHHLKKDSRVIALLNQNNLEYPHLIERQIRQRGDELLVEIEEAIRQLEQRGEIVSHVAIYQFIGRKREELVIHPRVWSVLQSSVEASRQQRKKKQEDDFVANVMVACDQLEALGEPLTWFNICQKMGVPNSRLYKYPEAVSYLRHRTSEAMYRKRFI